jgi:hypothetical protein
MIVWVVFCHQHDDDYKCADSAVYIEGVYAKEEEALRVAAKKNIETGRYDQD